MKLNPISIVLITLFAVSMLLMMFCFGLLAGKELVMSVIEVIE